MKRIHNAHRIPYGGAYALNAKDKGIVGYGTNFPAVVKSAAEWRRANSIPVGLGFEEEVEQEICERYPDECDDNTAPKIKKGSFKMWDIVRGTSAFIRQRLSDTELVSQEEANRRSALCSNCPAKIVFRKPCSGLCNDLVRMLSSTKGKTTPTDNDVAGCGICRCWIKVSVWYDLKIQCATVDESMKQAFDKVRKTYPCWKQCI